MLSPCRELTVYLKSILTSVLFSAFFITGSLHLSVHGKDAESFLGHLDISKSAIGQEWSTSHFCPSHSAEEVEKYVTFVGTPGLQFAVEIAHVQDLKIGQSRDYDLSHTQYSGCLFQFIPPKDISKTQLDVTVTSKSDVPAYLKVSKHCKDVTKENIRVVDYKGESIRLSFAKKGRITLSTVSRPPLTDSTGTLFIGMALKNDSSTTTKTVTLTLRKSFDYLSVKPIMAELFVPALILGLVVAVWALKCFKEPLVKPRAPNSLDLTEVSYGEIFNSMWSIISTYWFGRGPKTFSYITSIVGCVLMLGAFQFVFADWYLMIQEGDRDHCYYNDFCYRVEGYDLPFNLMISNLAYIVHAAILTCSVLWMEAELFARCEKLSKARDRNPPPPQSSSGKATLQPNNNEGNPPRPLPNSPSGQGTSPANDNEGSRPPPQSPSGHDTSLVNDNKGSRPPPQSPSGQATLQVNDNEGSHPPPQSPSGQATSLVNDNEGSRPPPQSPSGHDTSLVNDNKGSRPPPQSPSGQATSQVSDKEGSHPPPQSPSGQATSQVSDKEGSRPPPQSPSGQATSQGNDNEGSRPPPQSPSGQATSQGNDNEGSRPPPQSTISERLPWHVLSCPNISPHLTTMAVPKQESEKLKKEVRIRIRAEGYKRKFSFSIGYAFAWALLFEGLFSTLYHLCPSKMTFQFDTAFMFLIAGLIVVLRHNGIESEECSPDGEAKGDVGAANFFLGFIVPLYIFNYFGSLYHVEAGITSPVPFFIFLCLWFIMIALWATYRLYPKKWSKKCISEDKCKFILFVLSLILPIAFVLGFGLTGDFPEGFLFTCIAESAFAISWRAFKKVKNFCKHGCQCTCSCLCPWRAVYILVFLGTMIAALFVFFCKPSTNKTRSPEESRDLNHDCFDAFGYFDFHDLWHLLSSFALLMGVYLVMYISTTGSARQPDPADNIELQVINEPRGGVSREKQNTVKRTETEARNDAYGTDHTTESQGQAANQKEEKLRLLDQEHKPDGSSPTKPNE